METIHSFVPSSNSVPLIKELLNLCKFPWLIICNSVLVGKSGEMKDHWECHPSDPL